MPDPDTQKAINETLRNACNRLGDQVSKLNRKLDGDATESPLLAERMLAYSHAMKGASGSYRADAASPERRSRATKAASATRL